MGINKFILKKPVIILLIISFMGLNSFSASFAEELKPIDIQLIDQNENPADQSTQENSSADTSAPLQGRAIMIDINSDKLEFFEDDDKFVATGGAEILIPEQNSRLQADKITFYQEKQELIAEGNVKITKNGKIIYGDYAKVDLDKESALINEPNTEINKIKISAKTANIYSDNIEALKGKITIDNKDLNRMLMTAKGYSQHEIQDREERIAKMDPNKRPSYRISARDVIIDSKPDVNVITIKNASLWMGKLRLASIPSLTFSTDKQLSRIESQLPEIGHNQELGTYFGPGHVFYLPKGATLKVAPIVTFGGFGGGGIMRFMSDSNRTEFGYSTAKGKLVVEGEQRLSENTKLFYGANSYMDDGYFNYGKPKYAFDIVHEKKLASMGNFNFYGRTSAGYAKDYGYAADNNSRIDLSDYEKGEGTARFRFQGNIINDKPIFKVKDNLLQMRMQSQFGVSLYGTGDTFGILRAGPRFDSRIGRLKLSTTYFQAISAGDSPFLFDKYMEGKSNVVLSSDYKVSDRLNIGYISSLNLTKDNWDGKLATENQLYARVGPDDLKFRVGYDFVRQRSVFGVDVLLGPGKSIVDYDKLKVKEYK